MIDAERCKKVVNAIRDLSKTEIDELFKLLYKDNCEYTQNNNGIFFNLSWVSEETMVKIEQFVEFCNQSNTELMKYETLCNVLNHKLYQDEASSSTPKETLRDKQAKNSLSRMRHRVASVIEKPADIEPELDTETVPIINAEEEGEEDAEQHKGVSVNGKMSSSMKFYLLKKRFSKPLILTTTYENDLMTEAYIM